MRIQVSILHRLLPITAFLLSFHFFSCTSTRQAEQIRDVDQILAAYAGSGNPGAAVAVIRGDSVLFSSAYGMADVAKRIPVTTSTNFRLASVTKQFTATAVLLLIRDRKISFDTNLTDILPDFPAHGSNITVRHLLTHTSGLVDYESLIPDSQTVQVHDEDVVRLLRSVDSTLFKPGTAYQYSNSGYAVLAQIVQTISGKRFADVLKDRVLSQAGMPNSVVFEEGTSSVIGRAYGHTRTADGWKFADQSVTSAVLGDGGIYSSINDLIHWAKALSDSKLLGTDLQHSAFSPQFAVTDSLSYGYGWFIVTKGPTMVYHTGSTRGFRTAIVRIPSRELAVILLTNRNEGDVLAIAQSISELYTNKAP